MEGAWVLRCPRRRLVIRREKERGSRKERFARRFGKFSAVGFSNALVDVGVLNLLIWLYPSDSSLEFALYNVAGLALANTNSYVWNTLWTFRGRTRGDAKQKGLFSLQALANVGINAGLFWASISLILGYTALSSTVGGNLAKVLSTVTAFTVSFFILQYLVFPKGGRPGDDPSSGS